jgi:4a-hydroxytetrahydrobiopterin dehydratase
MSAFAAHTRCNEPSPQLSDSEIERRLAGLPGWTRNGNEITKTFTQAYNECLHLAMYVGAKAREIGRHPDIDIRWQKIRFGITTHDAGNRITDLDFALAEHIDGERAGNGAKPIA